MHITVSPSSVSGTLPANPSKSHAQRAIAIASLTNGTSLLSGIGSCDDVQSALHVAEAMGARLSYAKDAVTITGGGFPRSSIWDCGESGLCLRMYAAIAALLNDEITLTTRGTLTSRPVGSIADTFGQLGVSFRDSEGHAPLYVKGPYAKHRAVLEGGLSSQFLSGLLIALPRVAGGSILEVANLKSRPYIDLTLQTLRDFGIQIHHNAYHTFHISGGQMYKANDLNIQGDWSGMACILVAAAIAGEVSVTGLPAADTQADGRILEALRMCGAQVVVEDAEVIVRHEKLQPFHFDCTQCPDLFPPLVALATHCSGSSTIRGVHRLKSKESDRGAVLAQEFRKLGVDISHIDDALLIRGGRISGASVDAHGDHRVAMALAVTSLKADHPVTISGCECVSKSYPDFFKDLATIGAIMQNQAAGDE